MKKWGEEMVEMLQVPEQRFSCSPWRGAREECEAEVEELLWTDQTLPSPFAPQGWRWRISEWRSTSEEGKGKRYFSFCVLFLTIPLYFNLQYITYMLPKSSLFCYDGNW